MLKQSALKDDASFYQPRKEQTEREKLKEMTLKGKFSYLWEYYRIKALIILGAFALCAYIIYNIVTPDVVTQFYAAIVDSPLSDDAVADFTDKFAASLQLDPKTEAVNINPTFYFSADDEYAMNMKQALTTYVSSQEVDVIIAPEAQFSKYAYNGYFDKISDQLPTNIYSNLTDYFYLTSTEEDSEVNTYGIYLRDTELFSATKDSEIQYILGIVVNSPHKENTIEFIRALFSK